MLCYCLTCIERTNSEVYTITLFNSNIFFFYSRQELQQLDGGEVPHEDLHGEQGEDREAQPPRLPRQAHLHPQDEPLRRPPPPRVRRHHERIRHGRQEGSQVIFELLRLITK